jgi:hypothetical protein
MYRSSCVAGTFGPATEVLVYRGDELVTTEWCDSEDDAAEVVARWSEQPGVRCVVHDLSTRAVTTTYEPDASDEGPIEGSADDYASEIDRAVQQADGGGR